MKKINSKWLALIVAGLLLLTVFAAIFALTSWRAYSAEVMFPQNGTGGEENNIPSGQLVEKGRLTVLVAGTDRASGLSDVLMLLSLDRSTGEAWIMQLPRDTYVHCGKGTYRKLNGAPSALGGMGEFRNFMAEALGVPIHRYVRLTPDAFQQAIDAIGGVEIELEEALNYEDPAQGLSIHLPAGKQTLDGAAAEQFVRFRSDYVRGDLGRMDAQKIFLAALFEQLRSDLTPMTVTKLGIALLGNVETDLSLQDLMILSEEITSLQADKVYFLTAPGADVTSTKGASFYVLSAPAMNEILWGRFGGEEQGFDPNKSFLYGKSRDFSEIYEEYAPYEVVTATGIEENGLGIQRKE